MFKTPKKCNKLKKNKKFNNFDIDYFTRDTEFLKYNKNIKNPVSLVK